MKSNMMKLSVLIAVFMAFLISGNGWAGKGAETHKGFITIEGMVTGVSEDTCSVTVEDTYTVYGLGPVSYWDRMEVDRLGVGDRVIIDAYYCTDLEDGEEPRYVAISVSIWTEGDDGTWSYNTIIQLRDDEDLLPLWRSLTRSGQSE